MARKTRRRVRPTSIARLAKLETDLAACGKRIEQLESQIATHIKRMGAMQAEIDHLRSMRGQH